MKISFAANRWVIASTAAIAIFLGAPPNSRSAETNPPGMAAATAHSPVPLQYGTSEVVKMYRGGISKDIIVNYINTSTQLFHLSADEIISLQRLGVPDEITKAMLVRDRGLQEENIAQAYPPSPPPGYMPPASMPPYGAVVQQPVVTPATPAPDVTVIGGDSYPYDYGYYGYPYYGYGGALYLGGGWGWGWNGRGWGWNRGFRGGFGGFRGGVGGFHGGSGGYHGGVGGFHGGSFGGSHFGGGGHGGGGHR